jgi:hypothetical protein
VLEVEFEQTSAFAWLRMLAADFGYYLSYPMAIPLVTNTSLGTGISTTPNPSSHRTLRDEAAHRR